jgi:hypothetical protein
MSPTNCGEIAKDASPLVCRLPFDNDEGMGFMDGAANGLKLRLEAVGVPPAIAFSIGQVAYVGRKNRPQWVPEPVVGKSEVTWLVSQFEPDLRRVTDPQAKSAYVFLLCTKIFGAVEGDLLFQAGYPANASKGNHATAGFSSTEEQETSRVIDGALRYFDEIDLSFLGDRLMVPAVMFRGSGDDQQQWLGFVMSKDGMFGFFEESDCLVDDMADGEPVLYRLSDLRACKVRIPESIYVPPDLQHVLQSDSSREFNAKLIFGDDVSVMQFAVLFSQVDEEMREEVAQHIQQLLGLFDKALSLQDSAN